MYQKIKDYVRNKIIEISTNVASRVAENRSREIASQVAIDVSNQKSQEIASQVANKISEQKANEILNIINENFSTFDEKLGQSTHIIFELLKQINASKEMPNENPWDRYSEKHMGLWLGGHSQLVDGKKPVNDFFGGGINCVLSNIPLKIVSDGSTLDDIEVLIFWGQSSHVKYLPLLYNAVLKQKEILFAEDGFIYNLISHTKSLTSTYPKKWTMGMSFTIDDITAHFDGSIASRLELKILSNYKLSALEVNRSQLLIKKIVEQKITKYNYQSLVEKTFGTREEKVLVVDQAYGDYSVYKSGATEKVFVKMLNDALNENPNADILVKVHPDMVANPNRAGSKKGGYFASMKLDSTRIILIKEEINPYIIINQVQKVYVCTSQLGFESLMAGKKVFTYGIPFYAGWGLTVDRGKKESLKRRNIKTRTTVELFWFAYIWYSRYFNPVSGEKCEIENVLGYIINERTVNEK